MSIGFGLAVRAGLTFVRLTAGATVGAIEATALEHDANWREQLAQPARALGTVGQRRVGELLHGVEAVLTRGARVGVGRHVSPPLFGTLPTRVPNPMVARPARGQPYARTRLSGLRRPPSRL